MKRHYFGLDQVPPSTYRYMAQFVIDKKPLAVNRPPGVTDCTWWVEERRSAQYGDYHAIFKDPHLVLCCELTTDASFYGRSARLEVIYDA